MENGDDRFGCIKLRSRTLDGRWRSDGYFEKPYWVILAPREMLESELSCVPYYLGFIWIYSWICFWRNFYILILSGGVYILNLLVRFASWRSMVSAVAGSFGMELIFNGVVDAGWITETSKFTD